MPTILMILKVILAVWMSAIAVNYFCSLYGIFVSIRNQTDINIDSIRRARFLLVLGIMSVWITSLLIYFEEILLIGKSTEYSAVLMYVMGIVSLIITITTAISAISVAWSKNQYKLYTFIFGNFVGISFVFTIVLWVSVWAIS
jgi:hypothetical protein